MSDHIYYFEELAHSGYGPRTIHKVTVEGYVAIGSINAFNSGKRKTASKEDREFHRDVCSCGPKSLFICRADWEMDMSFEGTYNAVASIERLRKEKFPEQPPEPNLIEKQYGGDYKSWKEIPTVDHDGIKAFFNHIGFDHKARGYVDPDGNAIKYSVVKPKPKEKKAAAPDIEM